MSTLDPRFKELLSRMFHQADQSRAGDEHPGSGAHASPEELEQARRAIKKRLRTERLRAGASSVRRGPAIGGRPLLEPVRYGRATPWAPSPAAARSALLEGPPVALDDALQGFEVQTEEEETAWVLAERALLLQNDLEDLHEALRLGGATSDRLLEAFLPGNWRGHDYGLEDLLFLDLETAGLSNAPVFLIGAMVWEEDGLVVRQFLARDYAEERAILTLFNKLARGRRLYVTFNGKSFDVPFLRARARTHRVTPVEPETHLDLLHASRRVWKGRFADCRLQTLEQGVCGRARRDDIPGREIPDAYHRFVRTGDAREMVEVLRHNICDLVTLAELMIRLPH